MIGVGAYLLFFRRAPAEVAELIAEGGEKLLRDPMRPARGAPRVLIFGLDGVGADVLDAAIATGNAPHIAGLLEATAETGVYAHAYAVPGVLSILPSTTVAAWTSLVTGEPPARSGVPGNEWFARDEMRFYAPAPTSVSDHADALRIYTDGLMGQAVKVPSLFERAGVRSYVSLLQLHRGADLLTQPEPASFGDLISAAAAGLIGNETVSQEAYQELDRNSVESLLGSVAKHGLADLQFIYFPGIDLYTHVANDPLADQSEYIRTVTDSLVGEVLEAYRERGALDDTYVLFVADHGHTPVIDDDLHALQRDGGDEPPAILVQSGFRLRPFVVDPGEDHQDYQATVAYQGAMAYVYLADRSTCPNPGDRCDWARGPRLQADVLPVVRAFDEANRFGTGVPPLRGTLDLILARQPRPTSEEALPFEVWDGSRLVPIGQYLAANPRPELLDLENRLNGLAAGPFGHRAGDVLLLAKAGANRPIEERFYFSGRYHSWHGSPTDQDSRIPLIIARRASSGAELREQVRAAVGSHPSQLDITALVLALLGEQRAPAGNNGVGNTGGR